MLPALTDPVIVQQAVAGVLRGHMRLSISNIEAVLVLANAVGVSHLLVLMKYSVHFKYSDHLLIIYTCSHAPGQYVSQESTCFTAEQIHLLMCLLTMSFCLLQFESLESACLQFVSQGIHHMTRNALLSVGQLGDHLGLTSLVEIAAEELIQMFWTNDMQCLKQILHLPYFKHHLDRINKLVHHAKRGAQTELQVLELMELCELPEDDIAAVLSISTMQPAEVHTLFGILTNGRHPSSVLLHKAVTQHLKLPASCPGPTMTTGTFIVNNIMLPGPDQAGNLYTALPSSQLRLVVKRNLSEGKSLSPARSRTYFTKSAVSNLILTSRQQSLC